MKTEKECEQAGSGTEVLVVPADKLAALIDLAECADGGVIDPKPDLIDEMRALISIKAWGHGATVKESLTVQDSVSSKGDVSLAHP